MTRRVRPWLESISVDLGSGWIAAPPMQGIVTKILSDDMDEAARTGGRTKLVRFDPGAFATRELVHDFWEETYLVSGSLALGCDDAGQGGDLRTAPLYACRPPGTRHGRMASPDGCLLLEIQYYTR